MKKSKKLMILGLSAATAAVAATGAVSSFAWFATNAEVSVGMKIKANASQYLEISHHNAADTSYTQSWAKSVATTIGEKEVTPVSLGAGLSSDKKTLTAGSTWSSHVWAAASAAIVDDKDKATDDVYSNVTTTVDKVSYEADYATSNVYAIVEEFDIRLRYIGDETSTYTLSADVEWKDSVPNDASYLTSDTSKNTPYYLHNAARVYFVVGEIDETGTKAKAIDSGESAKSTGVLMSSASSTPNQSGDWEEAKTLVSSFKAAKSDTEKTGGDGLGNGVRVRVYYYLDGEDDNCFTSAVLGESYSINLKFSVSKNNANA